MGITNIPGKQITPGTVNSNAIEPNTLTNDDMSLSLFSPTTQGNSFNGPNELVQLDGHGALPAVDGSHLLGIPSLPDPGAVRATLSVGSSGSPANACFDGNYVWVTLHATNRVVRILASNATLSDTYFVGSAPGQICFDGAYVWIVNTGDNTLSKLSVADGSNAPGSPFSVPASSEGVCFDGSHIWLSSGADTLTKLNLDGTTALTATVSGFPFAMACDGPSIWVTNVAGNTVSQVRVLDGALLGTHSVGVTPIWIAFDGSSMWVSNFGEDVLTKLSTADGSVIQNISISTPRSLAFDGLYIWVANGAANSVTQIMAASGTILNTVNVGQTPGGVCFDGSNIWVVNNADSSVTKVYDPTMLPLSANLINFALLPLGRVSSGGGSASVGASGVLQMSNGSGGLSASPVSYEDFSSPNNLMLRPASGVVGLVPPNGLAGVGSLYVGAAGHGNIPSIGTFGSNGVSGAPTATVNGDILGDFYFGGAAAAGSPDHFHSYVSSFMLGIASENWSLSSGGSRMLFFTTPNGTQVSTHAMTLDQDQTLSVLGSNINIVPPPNVPVSLNLGVSGNATSTVIFNGGSVNYSIVKTDTGPNPLWYFSKNRDISGAPGSFAMSVNSSMDVLFGAGVGFAQGETMASVADNPNNTYGLKISGTNLSGNPDYIPSFVQVGDITPAGYATNAVIQGGSGVSVASARGAIFLNAGSVSGGNQQSAKVQLVAGTTDTLIGSNIFVNSGDNLAGYSAGAASPPPAQTTAGGENLLISINGEASQTVTLAAWSDGPSIAADIQSQVSAMTASLPANQYAYTRFTATFASGSYTLTSPGDAVNFILSSVSVTGGSFALLANLGIANGGREISGNVGSIQFGLGGGLSPQGGGTMVFQNGGGLYLTTNGGAGGRDGDCFVSLDSTNQDWFLTSILSDGSFQIHNQTGARTAMTADISGNVGFPNNVDVFGASFVAHGQVHIIDGTQAAGYVFTSDAAGLGSWQPAAGGGAPGGADQQIQFNNSGLFGGSGSFTWDDAAKILTILTGADNPFKIGPLQTDTEYNMVSLNGVLVSPGNTGIMAGKSFDQNLYVDCVSDIVLRPSNSNTVRALVNSSGLSVNGNLQVGQTIGPVGTITSYAVADAPFFAGSDNANADFTISTTATPVSGTRIKSDTRMILTSGGGAPDALFVEYATGYVGIQKSAPVYPVDVAGDVNITGQYRVNGVPISAGSSYPSVTTQTATYLALASDNVILSNATSGAMLVNLPAASAQIGQTYNIKKIDASANTVTITPNGPDLIDGAGSVVMNIQYQSYQIVSDGTNWWVI